MSQLKYYLVSDQNEISYILITEQMFYKRNFQVTFLLKIKTVMFTLNLTPVIHVELIKFFRVNKSQHNDTHL